jgi:hypothetical protein
MPQFKFVNIKCIQRRISELFRDKVVQYFVEICRSKKNLRLAHLRNYINKNPQKNESVFDLNGSLNFKNIAV